MRPPSRPGLSAEDAALWARVAETITPLTRALNARARARRRKAALAAEPASDTIAPPSRADFGAALDGPAPGVKKPAAKASLLTTPAPQPLPRPLDRHGLDGSWDRRLARGLVAPDAVLDMHGLTLDGAWARLDSGLALAVATGARVVLVIAGKARPRPDHALRSEARGAIRAKLMDWLAAGPHAGRIAAVRPAHIRHGGAGAVYVVLRKQG